MRHGIRRRSQLPKSLLLRAKVLIELLRCICRLLALLGPREMADLSPQSKPKQTLSRSLSRTARDGSVVSSLNRGIIPPLHE
jgi:hypothetical protein